MGSTNAHQARRLSALALSGFLGAAAAVVTVLPEVAEALILTKRVAQRPVAQAGVPNSTSYMKRTLSLPTGDTRLDFSFFVESELRFDCLRLFVGGSEVDLNPRVPGSGACAIGLSGFIGRGSREVKITKSGPTEIRFEYHKDGNIDKGRDTVWVDAIKLRTWPTGASVPTTQIFDFDDNAGGVLGATVSCPPGAICLAGDSWNTGGYDVNGARSDFGWFRTTAGNEGVARRPAKVSNYSQINAAFLDSPANSCIPGTGTCPIGTACSASGNKCHAAPTRTWMEHVFVMPPSLSDGYVTFDYFVDSEKGHDCFYVYLDDVQKELVPGQSGFECYGNGVSGRQKLGVGKVVVPKAGTAQQHIIRFEYDKDAAVDFGRDTALVDNVVITAPHPYFNDAFTIAAGGKIFDYGFDGLPPGVQVGQAIPDIQTLLSGQLATWNSAGDCGDGQPSCPGWETGRPSSPRGEVNVVSGQSPPAMTGYVPFGEKGWLTHNYLSPITGELVTDNPSYFSLPNYNSPWQTSSLGNAKQSGLLAVRAYPDTHQLLLAFELPSQTGNGPHDIPQGQAYNSQTEEHAGGELVTLFVAIDDKHYRTLRDGAPNGAMQGGVPRPSQEDRFFAITVNLPDGSCGGYTMNYPSATGSSYGTLAEYKGQCAEGASGTCQGPPGAEYWGNPISQQTSDPDFWPVTTAIYEPTTACETANGRKQQPRNLGKVHAEVLITVPQEIFTSANSLGLAVTYFGFDPTTMISWAASHLPTPENQPPDANDLSSYQSLFWTHPLAPPSGCPLDHQKPVVERQHRLALPEGVGFPSKDNCPEYGYDVVGAVIPPPL